MDVSMRTKIGAIAVFAVSIWATPLFAHHTISAVYDVDTLVTLKGVVTEVDWRNPHVVFHLDVRNDDGSVESWAVETQAVYILKRKGLPQDFARAGDAVSMDVFLAKDGSRKAAMQSITSPAGTATVSMLPNGALR
jgi:hypothetical protein